MKQLAKVEEKLEKVSDGLSEVFEKAKIYYTLFAISSVFVIFSIVYGHYFFQAFLTFMYSVYMIHIQLAKKHAAVDGWKADWKHFYHICLQIFSFLGFFIWIVLILKSFLEF